MGASGKRGVRRRRRAPCVAAVLLLGASAAACSTGSPAPLERDPSPRTAPTSSGAVRTPAETPRRPRTVRIAVGGDVHFEGPLRDRLDDPATALLPLRRVLAAADVAVVNLETSVGTGGRPEPGKRFTFSAPATAFDALAAAGVDVAVMANNHALDLGRARLPSTLHAAASAPLAVVGIGADARAAFRPAMTRVRGIRVATLAASVADQDPTADPTAQWAAADRRAGIAVALDPRRLLGAVRAADRSSDVVVTYLHWGVQGQPCPSDDQRALAARLVAAGADVVVGSHAHELQGDGPLGRGHVAYGLGNLAWYSPGPAGVLTLVVRPPARPDGRATVVGSRWWDAEIGADGLPSPVRGSAVGARTDARERLRSCAGLTG